MSASRNRRADVEGDDANIISEYDLQKECFESSQTDFGVKIHWVGSANGLRCSQKTAKDAKASGAIVKGVPDIMILNRGAHAEPGLAIEFKVIYKDGKKNNMDKDQLKWFQILRGQGWRCAPYLPCQQWVC